MHIICYINKVCYVNLHSWNYLGGKKVDFVVLIKACVRTYIYIPINICFFESIDWPS